MEVERPISSRHALGIRVGISSRARSTAQCLIELNRTGVPGLAYRRVGETLWATRQSPIVAH
jgi:hypothetical protein